MSNLGDRVGVLLADGPNLDAFSRLRVSQPNILYTGIFDYDKRPDLWAEKLIGGASAATHDPDSRTITLDLGTASGEKIIRQTKEYFRYTTGNSHLVFNTFHLGPRKANLRRRSGYFDDDNGIFIEQVEGDIYLVLRSSASGVLTDLRVPQSQWSEDHFDGEDDENNPTGLTLDEDSTQILAIDLQWLGVGRVRVYFDIAGQLYPVHDFENANEGQTIPYMGTPNLPCRYEIENLGVTASGSSLRQICSAVIREGGEQTLGTERAIDLDIAAATATNAKLTMLGLRLKPTHIRAIGRVLGASVLNLDANDAVRYAIYKNPSVDTSSASWNSVADASALQFSTSNIDISAGPGDLIFSDYTGAAQGGRGVVSKESARDARILADIDGNSDEIWLVVQDQAAGQTALVLPTLKFDELR